MPRELKALSERDRKFADEYLKDYNATRAAKRAGFSPVSAHVEGCLALKKPKVIAHIRQRQAALAKKYEVTQERIVAELAKIGFSTMGDYMRVTPDGQPYIDLSDLQEAEAAALSEITVDDYVDGRGDNARDVKRVKIKLHDKKGALVDLAKHLGMFAKNGDEGDDTELKIVVEGGLPDADG